MNVSDIELSDSLLKWFQVLNTNAPHKNASQLSDGVALAQALNSISSDFFNDNWVAKIKTDVGSNWRLKVSNLRKVVEAVFDYYTDVLNLNLNEFRRPDVNKIAEHNDNFEMGRLLQLLLGLAVNCDKKATYINQIMELEESLQRNIMQALQELEMIWVGPTSSRMSINLGTPNLKEVQDERDVYAQKYHEAEQKISILMEEKSTLNQEIKALQTDLAKYENPSQIDEMGASIGPIQPGSARYNEMRRQLDTLKNELLQSETAKDDFKMKCVQQEQEILTYHAKIEDMQKTAMELAQLKDENDVLREASEKYKVFEGQVNVLKKKLDDYNDLKKQVKQLEERNAEIIHQNSRYEEDSKRISTLKGQVDLYKREIQELNSKLDTEMNKNVKIEFQCTNLEANITTLQRENDRLRAECDSLKDICEELQCNQQGVTEGNAISKEMVTPDLRQKIKSLESENKALREGAGGNTALSQLLQDANERTEKLREQLRVANQQILVLQENAKTGEKKSIVSEVAETADIKGPHEDISAQLISKNSKIAQLEALVTSRDQEIVSLESRFKKCQEKAKEIIKSIDPRAVECIAQIDKTTNDTETESNANGMSQLEEKLIVSAYNRLALTCQKEAVDARLAMLNGSGQSFLSRQRHPVARKPVKPKP